MVRSGAAKTPVTIRPAGQFQGQQWKADPSWQKFVRYSWARGTYWYNAALPLPQLGIDDAAIWQRVTDATNLAEIQLFTGDDAGLVACTP
jgi:hypothetical protein